MQLTDFESTRVFWGDEIVRGNLIWPDENVVRFIKRNFSPGAIVLDYGCGAGRNSFALAREGYELIAMDYTDEAIRIIESRKMDFAIRTVKNKALDVPLPEETVDAVIADGSLFYNGLSDNISILKNLKCCMKAGGKIWANWRTKNDSLFEKGIMIGEGLYRLDAETKREGCSYFFCNEEELRTMYEKAGLRINSLEDFVFTENNRNNISSYYHVVAEKTI